LWQSLQHCRHKQYLHSEESLKSSHYQLLYCPRSNSQLQWKPWTTPTMTLNLLRKILASPNPPELVQVLQGETVPNEVLEISRFTDRELLDLTGATGPVQFKSLMASYRLAPKEIVLSFVLECGLHVLPIAKDAYPAEALLDKVSRIHGLSLDETFSLLEELSPEIKELHLRSDVDRHAAGERIMKERGFVPLEVGEAICRVFGAMSVLQIMTVIVTQRNSPRFLRNVDCLMPSLLLVYPNASNDLEEWMVQTFLRQIEAYESQ